MTELVRAFGWRKRQANEIVEKIRNDTLEEGALEFEKLKALVWEVAELTVSV